MSFQFHRSRRAGARTRQLNLTSIIDVVVLLLIFFMLSTRFIQERSLEVMLPAPFSGSKERVNTPFIITMLGGGKVRMVGENYDLVTFPAAIRTLIAKAPEKPFLVRTGKDVAVQEMIVILDEIYKNGGQHVALAE